MQIVDNKALVLRTRNPDKFSVIPKHKVLREEDGIYEVACYWGLDESRVLRNLGFKDVPSPITKRYDWPGRYRPMAHQIDTSAFLTMHRRAFCFNDTGTGKTLSVLWAADYLMRLGKVRRVLILCPLSIMQSAWMRDISNSILHRSAIVAHHAQASRRIEMIQANYEIVIVNYDGLNLIAGEVRKDGRFDLIIADEANFYKNPQTRRWKALASIITPKTYLWMMTGTPAAQSPVDAYGLAKLVNPEGVPRFFTAWRDKVMNKISMFKWVPKVDAAAHVHMALQPAIRYSKDQCLDLPPVVTLTREVPMTPQQNKYYKLLKEQLLVKAAGQTISAVNAGVAINKLLQISCIAYNTPVLTSRGWVPIQLVRSTDLLWDGAVWVQHEGLVNKGMQRVVRCHGVEMTLEHEVLTRSGWRTAREVIDGNASEGLDRAGVRLPDGVATPWHVRWEDKKGYVALSMHMRQQGGAGEPVSAYQTPAGAAALRMHAREQDARHVARARVSQLDEHVAPLHGLVRQGLAQLRRAWDHGVQALAVVREVLGRYGADLQARAYAGPREEPPRVLEGQLQVGDAASAGQQHPRQRVVGNTERVHDGGGSSACVRDQVSHPATTAGQAMAVDGSAYENAVACVEAGARSLVYDIKNCGPRHRFVVQGNDGLPLLVHNCGAAYTDDKEVVEFDASPRLAVLDEIIEETSRKVIIFALFRSSIDTIVNHLRKQGIECDQIHGDVPPAKRGPIIHDFQTRGVPLTAKDLPAGTTQQTIDDLNAVRRGQGVRALVMQPQATAHGITLTAADTVVFYGPLMSVEQYQQCIARADRKGQDADKVTVIHIEGSPIEKKLFKAMASKVSDHTLLVGLFDTEAKEK